MDTLEEDIPNKIWKTDTSTAIYANMFPPGIHFFYFIQQKNIFLSPNYDVVRFKNTNMFLNRIVVSKRLEEIETVFISNTNALDEAVFMKERSIFKDFKEDTDDHLKQCFEQDMQWGKIARTVRKGDVEKEFKKIKETLLKHYKRIVNIYTYYMGISSFPTISMNDFNSLAKHTGILDGVIMDQASFDLIYVATCVSNHSYSSSAERDLQRYELFEIIVRIANHRYKERGKVKTCSEGIEKTLKELIYPHTKTMDGEYFRKKFCYNVKVNEVLEKNESQLKKIYDSHTHAKKKFITKEECAAYIRKVGLQVSELMIGAIYGEALMTVVDTITDKTRVNQMKFVEFVCFICRICDEHYKGTPFEKELLFLKIDKLMTPLLLAKDLDPLFLFNMKFKLEIKEDKLKLKKKQKKLKREMQRAAKMKRPVDQSLIDMVRKGQDDMLIALGIKKDPYQRENLLEGLSDESTGESGDDDIKPSKAASIVVDLTKDAAQVEEVKEEDKNEANIM